MLLVLADLYIKINTWETPDTLRILSNDVQDAPTADPY